MISSGQIVVHAKPQSIELKSDPGKENVQTMNLGSCAGSEKADGSKSLGENCKKFLQLFGAKNGSEEIINIDDCIEQLGIGRRRIYDIINILESFRMIKRLKKNEYSIKPATFIQEMI
jgi:transcription factor E2F7/8